MIICRVCQSFNDRLTQLSTHLYPLTLEQRKLGIDVQVVVNEEDVGRQDYDYVHTFKYEKKGLNSFLPFSALTYGNQAYNIMKKINYDIVHGHQAVCFGLAFKDLKAPFVYTIHNTAALPSEAKGDLKEKYANFIETSILARKANVLTTVSELVRDKIIKDYKVSPEKVKTVPAGFYPEIFKPLKNNKSNNKTILFVGRMTNNKGIDVLLKAIPLVLKEHKSAKFVFVGSKKGHDLHDYLKKMNKDSIKVVEEVPQKELVKYYNECSVYVLPARQEAAGKTTLEAMGCAKPVILSDQTGYSNMVKKKKCGLITPYGDYETLASSINKLLENVKMRRIMGENARKASLKYSWQNIAKMYTPIYESIMKK